MSQQDGLHDVAFWKREALNSHEESGLASESTIRSIDTKKIRSMIEHARNAKLQNVPVKDLQLNSHLVYLLEASCNWPDIPPPAAIQRSARKLGLEADDTSPWLDESISMLSQKQPLPNGATYSDAASVFLWYYETLSSHLHSNWGTYFRF